jgi:hypothetical protein
MSKKSSPPLICPNCRWTEFYEDDQGALICGACGVQSQEFIPESFDIDDVSKIVSANISCKRATRLIHSFLSLSWLSKGMEVTRTGGRIRATTAKKGPRQSTRHSLPDEPETAEFLLVYQYCLRMITSCVVKISNSSVADFNDGVTGTSISQYFLLDQVFLILAICILNDHILPTC